MSITREQHDEWAVARRYMSAESIAKALADRVDEPEEVMAIEAARVELRRGCGAQTP